MGSAGQRAAAHPQWHRLQRAQRITQLSSPLLPPVQGIADTHCQPPAHTAHTTPPHPTLQVSDGGVASVLQLLHLFLEQPRWEAAAMERSKQQYLSHYRSLSKSLERATADRILQVRAARPFRALTAGCWLAAHAAGPGAARLPPAAGCTRLPTPRCAIEGRTNSGLG